MLIISDDGVQLLQNYNSNDNSLSRIGPDQKTSTDGYHPKPGNDLQNDLGSIATNVSQRAEKILAEVNVTSAPVTGNQTATTSADRSSI